MEVISLIISMSGVMFGAVGTYIGVSRHHNTKLKQLIITEIDLHLGDVNLQINTLEVRLGFLEQNSAKKEDMAEVRSDLKAVMQRLDDLKDLIINVRSVTS